jgi:large subunit ribosomal protein L21
MNIAVIKTGGKQYLVKEGLVLSVEKLAGANEGDTVTFGEVLLTDDGSVTKVGKPAVSGLKVSAKVVEVGKGKKVIVVKYKAKSRYHKKRGHRQPFTRVKIEKF